MIIFPVSDTTDVALVIIRPAETAGIVENPMKIKIISNVNIGVFF